MDPVPPHEPEQFQGTIRPFLEVDLQQVMRILLEGVVDPDTNEPIRYEIEEILSTMKKSLYVNSTREYLVATDISNKVVGVIGRQLPDERMLEFKKTVNPGEMINVFISKDVPEQGVGRAMVTEFEKKSKEKGFTELLVNSDPRYKKYWPFYDGLPGWEKAGIAMGYYGEGRDAPVWRKNL